MKKLLVGCLFTSLVTFGQQTQKIEALDSVFIDTKVPIARKNSGKVVAKITQEELQQQAGKSVASIINTVSGIEINGSRSNDGQNLSYFVRGGNNRQVVIMVDGVQLNDPSQIANDYDLRLIPASTISEIEIIKGASSVLYGSGAGTAVINITTKKASEKKIAATFTTSLGTNQSSENEEYKLGTITNHVAVNGTLGKFFYNATFGNRFTDGLSAVAAPEGEDAFEVDIFNRFNGRVNLGYKIKENITISQFFAFDEFKNDFDDFSLTDAENRSITKQLKTGGNFEWEFAKGKYVFNDSYTWIERETTSSFPTRFDSKSYNLDNYLSYNFSKQFTALIGLNVNVSSFNSFSIPFGENNFAQDIDEDIAKFDIIDPYVNATYISDFGLNINAGARLNIHSEYDTNVVYNVNPSYNIDFNGNNLKFLGSYSTAYITPSLFQLHDPQYGNLNLQPEDNTTLEGGLEFTKNDLRISAVYFTRNQENFVDFVTVDPDLFIFQYQNISEEFTSSGIEVEVSKTLFESLNVSANYTNTQADERFALRIPEHKINASAQYTLSKKTNFGLQFQYTSERDDSFFNPDTFENETITLDRFSLLDFNYSFQATKNLRLFTSITNIFNTEYEELFRFQTRGRNVRLGFSLNF